MAILNSIFYMFVLILCDRIEGSPPWEKKHLPPPPPTLPPHPSHHGICALTACNCTNVLLGGVHISCVCTEKERSLQIGQTMLPANAETLSISDCDGVLLESYGQHEDYIERPLSRLSIHRVTRLTLSAHALAPVLDVEFEDIRNIATLPQYAFQPPPSANDTAWTMHSLVFRNISEMKRVCEGAISDVHLSYFHWIDVNVIIVEDNAISVRIPTHGVPCDGCDDGSFVLAGIVIGELGVKALDVSGGRHVSIESCHISTLVPSSVSVHGASTFSFFRNYVLRSIAMFGLDVVATHVNIYKNRFGRLEENALVGVRPMATEDSTLRFEGNLLEEVDLMSLNVGWKVFTEFSNRREFPNVTGFSFRDNSFADCSCPHLGWMVQVALANDELFSSFYALVLDEESQNYCAREPVDPMGQHFPCRLPLAGLKDLFENDMKTCKRIVEVETICHKFTVARTNASQESLSIHLITMLLTLCTAFMAI